MTHREQKLLDKQLKRIVPTSAPNGTIILAVLGLFFAGVIVGGALSPQEPKPMPVAYLTR